MKKKLFGIIISIIFICMLFAGCTDKIPYEIINFPLGAPVSEIDYKTQMFKYNSYGEFELGISKFNKIDNDLIEVTTIDEEIFTDALLIHVVVYHTSSDVPNIKNIYKKENSVIVEINVSYPNSVQTEDEVFTHYFIKIERTEINSDTEFILNGNYKI